MVHEHLDPSIPETPRNGIYDVGSTLIIGRDTSNPWTTDDIEGVEYKFHRMPLRLLKDFDEATRDEAEAVHLAAAMMHRTRSFNFANKGFPHPYKMTNRFNFEGLVTRHTYDTGKLIVEDYYLHTYVARKVNALEENSKAEAEAAATTENIEA
jgi:hypothetical protein